MIYILRYRRTLAYSYKSLPKLISIIMLAIEANQGKTCEWQNLKKRCRETAVANKN